MQTNRFIVTIDGAAGTGKTTVAQELAKRLGTDCLDTGAMYRAVALLAIEHGIDPTNGIALSNELLQHEITFDWEQSPPLVLLDGRDVSQKIRELEIGRVVSIVAKQPEVRTMLVKQQRKIAEHHPLMVTEGRDQGSVVFPEADARFFLVAAVDERTKRRVKQLRDSGKEVLDADVQHDLVARDQIDSTRLDGPLLCPEGAMIIDTSELTLSDVVDAIETKVSQLLNS